LEADKTNIESIGKILSDYQTKISPYTKFLLSTFVDKTMEVVEPKLNEIDKKFKELQDSVRSEIDRYKNNLKDVEAFENYTFEWINKSKDEIRGEFQGIFKEVCQKFTKGGKIDLGGIPDVKAFIESVGEIADRLQTLGEINELTKECKTKAQEINEKLREWEAKLECY